MITYFREFLKNNFRRFKIYIVVKTKRDFLFNIIIIKFKIIIIDIIKVIKRKKKINVL